MSFRFSRRARQHIVEDAATATRDALFYYTFYTVECASD